MYTQLHGIPPRFAIIGPSVPEGDPRASYTSYTEALLSNRFGGMRSLEQFFCPISESYSPLFNVVKHLMLSNMH